MSWKCDVCGEDGISSRYNAKVDGERIGVCDDCGYKLLGRNKSDTTDYSVETDDGIVVNLKEIEDSRKVTSVWVEYGSVSVPIDEYDFDNPLELIVQVREELIEGEKKRCTSCNKLLNKDEVAATHFASVFCQGCWDDYKEENSRKCKICGSPLYRCVC